MHAGISIQETLYASLPLSFKIFIRKTDSGAADIFVPVILGEEVSVRFEHPSCSLSNSTTKLEKVLGAEYLGLMLRKKGQKYRSDFIYESIIVIRVIKRSGASTVKRESVHLPHARYCG